jgi:uncharacterized protein (TIGR00369 family)
MGTTGTGDSGVSITAAATTAATATSEPGQLRTRLHSWTAPAAVPDARATTGLETLQMILEGRLPVPSISSTLGFGLIEVAEGFAAFEGEPGEHLLNPMGTVHGGFLATLLDSAMGCAVMSALPAGRGYTTIQLGVHMVRPVFADTPTLRCEGHVIHVGRTTATAQGRVVGSSDGKVYAHGTTTCAVFEA